MTSPDERGEDRQIDIFDRREPIPYAKNSATSLAAAESIRPVMRSEARHREAKTWADVSPTIRDAGIVVRL
jgi:hypothetical protein